VMAAAMTILGALALSAGVTLASDVSVPLAAAAGVACGLVLYGATRVFVAIVAGPWKRFRADASSLYGARRDVPVWVSFLLGGVVVAAGEELFWRGFVQSRLAADHGELVAALWCLAAFIAVNCASVNLAVIAAAVVGGATWTALAWWSGGMLASLLCHGVWTGLMIAFPAVTVPDA